jgi:predicted ATPase
VTGATDTHLGEKAPESNVKGLYMWGGVGVGKTMLMDLFVRALPRHVRVKRAHYLDFMPEVHSLLQKFSGEQVRKGRQML